MPSHSRPSSTDEREEVEEDTPRVSACETRPGRTVFSEASSEDAWIATDLTVDVRR